MISRLMVVSFSPVLSQCSNTMYEMCRTERTLTAKQIYCKLFDRQTFYSRCIQTVNT